MMNHSKNLLKGYFFITAILISSALAFGGCGYFRHHNKQMSFEQRADRVVEKLTSELSLTDVQKTKLDAIKNEIIKKQKDQEQSMSPIKSEFTAMLNSETLDKAKLKALFQKKEETYLKAHGEFEDFLLDKFIEFHKILTPDQRAKFTKYLEKHHSHKHWMHVGKFREHMEYASEENIE